MKPMVECVARATASHAGRVLVAWLVVATLAIALDPVAALQGRPGHPPARRTDVLRGRS